MNTQYEKLFKNNSFPKNNIPFDTTELVGRESEISKISELLNNSRIVTLVGPGGIGKTRLAIHIAQLHLSDYTDGVYLVPLSSVMHGELALHNIAQIVNMPALNGQHNYNSVKNFLYNKKILIILDNFEQMVEESWIVSDLIASVPRLTFMITSRESLNIYGEHIFNVFPLEYPDPLNDVPLDTIKNMPAVSLFLARAKTVQNDFIITDENAKEVSSLCACLEGIPLAIELAAANIRQVSIRTMLYQSQNRLSWLKNGARDLPIRQQTLRSTIEWGYNLLNEEQKIIFKRLGVFKGAFNLKSSINVISINDDIPHIQDNFFALVNKSILYKAFEFNNEGYYFKMLEVIREYAAILLAESNELHQIRNSHADYFLSLVEEIENMIKSSDCKMFLKIIDIAYPDILEALEYLMTTDKTEKMLKFLEAISNYWLIRGYWSRAHSILQKILDNWDKISFKQYYIKLYPWYGVFTDLKGNYENALQIYYNGMKLAKEDNENIVEAKICHFMANPARKIGNDKLGEELLLRSLSIYRISNYKHNISEVLQDLGQLYFYKGDYEKAEQHLKESLEINMESNNMYGASKALGMMGLVSRGKGCFSEASEMFYKYLRYSEELDDKSGICDAIMSIAELERSQGNYDISEYYYLKCLKLGHDLGYMSITCRALKELGEINRYKGDFIKSYKLFQECMSLLNETGEKGDEIWLCRNIAELELQCGNILRAEELFVKGIKIYNGIKKTSLIYVFLVLEGLAGVSLALENLDRAARLLSAADKLYADTKNIISKMDSLEYKNRIAELEEKMDRTELQKAWSEGGLMSVENILDYALDINSYKHDKMMAKKLMDYIHNNYEKDISLNDISEHFNMSVNYLSTMFKYYTGWNFKDYLNFFRVKKAKELLQNGNIKINDISKKVGCNNTISFNRMFKKYEGVSPGQYWNQQTEKYR